MKKDLFSALVFILATVILFLMFHAFSKDQRSFITPHDADHSECFQNKQSGAENYFLTDDIHHERNGDSVRDHKHAHNEDCDHHHEGIDYHHIRMVNFFWNNPRISHMMLLQAIFYIILTGFIVWKKLV